MGYYRTYEAMQDGMKVILEMPEVSGEEEKEKQEIKKMLTAALNDCMQRHIPERDDR